MASSLATTQLAGVNAQLKCVPRALSRTNTGSLSFRDAVRRSRVAKKEITDDTRPVVRATVLDATSINAPPR
jgi:hypothetical protein